MNIKSVLGIVLVSVVSSVLSVWGYGEFVSRKNAGYQDTGRIPANYAGFFDNLGSPGLSDFTAASTSATPAVVHIKTKIKGGTVSRKQANPFSDFFGDDPFFQFFGGPRVMPDQQASGSGVLMSADGYIITNNHVINGASEIDVTMTNRKTYKATLIGADPSTDLAVIKIEGSNFPYMVYGNSDEVKLGQWVLAVGYPLNLDVTVTAGIISAKSRNIAINKSENAIESFIQTDAAVNPGNSGGALINTGGELIGINTAIASPTGSYAGYSYAIPVNIVKKTIADLIKFGAVQRAYIGIQYPQDGAPDEYYEKSGLKKNTEGVLVMAATEGGAASEAGIKKGDIIKKIDGVPVNSGPELQEQIARFKPGDKIELTYMRGDKEMTASLSLKNKVGNYNVVKNQSAAEKLGGELATIDKETARKNGIDGGVIVKSLGNGILKGSRMQEGFIITSVDGVPVNNLEELSARLKESAGGSVRLEGIYPGYDGTYGYPLNLGEN
jgi:Do/DeqQ family serine protease